MPKNDEDDGAWLKNDEFDDEENGFGGKLEASKPDLFWKMDEKRVFHLLQQVE